MPCLDGGPTESEMHRLTKSKLDDVTRMLCELCGKLEKKKGGKKLFTPELAEWWKAHKAADRVRKSREDAQAQQEQVRKRAYEKLTPEERDALRLQAPMLASKKRAPGKPFRRG